MRKIKKLILIISVIFLSLTSNSNAHIIMGEKLDLDFDGVWQEIVYTYFESDIDDENIYYPLYLAVKKVDSTYLPEEVSDYVDLTYIGGILEKTDVIDLNVKDKQKEIIIVCDDKNVKDNFKINLFTYKNGEISKLYDTVGRDYSIGSNKQQLLVLKKDYVPFEYYYWEKHKVEDGKVKISTPTERKVSVDGKSNLIVKSNMKIKAYTDKSLKKKSYTIQDGEKITILSVNNPNKYIKISNSKKQIAYIPYIEKNSKYYLKDYQKIEIVNTKKSNNIAFIGLNGIN